MTSIASGTLVSFQSTACDLADYPSSVNSGLVGNAAHRRNNSYHNSKNDNPNKSFGAYTNRWPKDTQTGINRSLVTGSDRSMSRADMIRSWNRHWVVFQNRATDPRAKYIAEYIGTPDGVNAKRMDFADGSVDTASEDHTWHEHEGWWYIYADSPEASKASLSMKRGETVAQYLGQDVPKGDQDVLILAQVTGNGGVWKGNGLECVGVPTPGAVRQLMAVGANGAHLSGFYNANGKPFGNEAEMYAVIGQPKGTVEISTEIAHQIARQIIEADTNDLTQNDLDAIEELVVKGAKEAARQGTGG